MAIYRITDENFIDGVELQSGENIRKCYQCGKCSASCPVTFEMDYLPNQVMRLIQLGMRDEVLNCTTIWLCASCITCTVRCPKDIDLAKIMDALRAIYIKERLVGKEEEIPYFHYAFLTILAKEGRLNEIKLITKLRMKPIKLIKEFILSFFFSEYRVKLRQLFNDLIMGIKMGLKLKLNPFVKGVKARKQIAEIFKRAGP